MSDNQQNWVYETLSKDVVFACLISRLLWSLALEVRIFQCFNAVRLTKDGPLSSFRLALFLPTPLSLQAIDGVMPLALCPQVVSRVSGK